MSFVDDLLSFDIPVHLVLDGALLDNIEKHLVSNGLVGRALFRETAHRETVLAGPWLVSPGLDRAAIERSVAAARGAGKGVFWLGDMRQEALFQHLRRLGAARMPDGRILYFRHYDSDVLAAIVPLANAEQAAHLFGPARIIAFTGGIGDGATVEMPDGLPAPPSGPITFERWQIEELDERQRNLSRNRIARILRWEYPESTKFLDDAGLHARVMTYEREAQSLNLTSEAALANWARLNLETNDSASQNVVLKNDISKIPSSQVDRVFVQSMPNLIQGYYQTRKVSDYIGRDKGDL